MMRYTIVRERVNLVRTTTRRDFIGVVSKMSYIPKAEQSRPGVQLGREASAL